MFDRDSQECIPTLSLISQYIHNTLWDELYLYMENEFQTKPQYEFSRCSWEHGWNVKFKKGSRSICTVYPRQGFLTVMVVIGPKEKEIFEELLPTMDERIQDIYMHTKEGNHQKWLMIDLEDKNQVYEDFKTILHIRADGKMK